MATTKKTFHSKQDVPRGLRVIGDRILIRVLPRPEVSAGGVILPESRNGREDRAIVVDVGSGRFLDGGFVKLGVQPGDRVCFKPYELLLVINELGAHVTNSMHARAGDYAVLREDAILYKEDEDGKEEG